MTTSKVAAERDASTSTRRKEPRTPHDLAVRVLRLARAQRQIAREAFLLLGELEIEPNEEIRKKLHHEIGQLLFATNDGIERMRVADLIVCLAKGLEYRHRDDATVIDFAEARARLSRGVAR